MDKEAEIDATVTDKSHHDRLIVLQKDALQFRDTFILATQEQDKANEIVEKLEKTGPIIRKKLERLLGSAYKNDNINAAYYTALVQQHYMLANYYAKTYLVYNEAGDAELVIKELNIATDQMNNLFLELQDLKSRKIANEVANGIQDYKKTFLTTQDVIATRNGFYKTVDTIGPAVMHGYDVLLKELIEKKKKLAVDAKKTKQNVADVSLMLGVIIAVFGAIVAFLMGRSLSKTSR